MPWPASLQRSRHLSQGSPASGSCSWSPRAPRASLHGPACCHGSRSSDDTSQLPVDGGCFLLGPLWLQGGSASMALTWTGRGAGPLPLGRDCETVQGPTRQPTPKGWTVHRGCHPAPASRSLEARRTRRPRSCGRPSGSEPRESLPLWAPSAEAAGRTASQHGCFPVFPALSPLDVRVIPNHGKH